MNGITAVHSLCVVRVALCGAVRGVHAFFEDKIPAMVQAASAAPCTLSLAAAAAASNHSAEHTSVTVSQSPASSAKPQSQTMSLSTLRSERFSELVQLLQSPDNSVKVRAAHAAVELEPTAAAEVGTHAGKLLWAADEPLRALSVCEAAIHATPEAAALYSCLAANRRGSSRSEQERRQREFRKAIALAPREAHGHLALGEWLRATGSLDDAIDTFRAGISAETTPSASLVAQRTTSSRAPRWPESVEGEERVRLRVALAQALVDRGRGEEAVAASEQAVSMAAEWAGAHGTAHVSGAVRGGVAMLARVEPDGSAGRLQEQPQPEEFESKAKRLTCLAAALAVRARAQLSLPSPPVRSRHRQGPGAAWPLATRLYQQALESLAEAAKGAAPLVGGHVAGNPNTEFEKLASE